MTANQKVIVLIPSFIATINLIAALALALVGLSNPVKSTSGRGMWSTTTESVNPLAWAAIGPGVIAVTLGILAMWIHSIYENETRGA